MLRAFGSRRNASTGAPPSWRIRESNADGVRRPVQQPCARRRAASPDLGDGAWSHAPRLRKSTQHLDGCAAV